MLASWYLTLAQIYYDHSRHGHLDVTPSCGWGSGLLGKPGHCEQQPGLAQRARTRRLRHAIVHCTRACPNKCLDLTRGSARLRGIPWKAGGRPRLSAEAQVNLRSIQGRVVFVQIPPRFRRPVLFNIVCSNIAILREGRTKR